jgi:hypothetical protein
MSDGYRYFYDDSGSMTRDVPDLSHGGAKRYADPWRYDDDTRRVIERNVARSFEADAVRARLAPTTELLRARVLAARP